MKKIMSFLWFFSIKHQFLFFLMLVGVTTLLSLVVFNFLDNKVEFGAVFVVIMGLIFMTTALGSLWRDENHRLVIFHAQRFLEQNMFYEKYVLPEIQRARITRNPKDLIRTLNQCVELEEKLTRLADVQQKAMKMTEERERIKDEIKCLKIDLGVEM